MSIILKFASWVKAIRPLSRERKRGVAVKNAGRRGGESGMLSPALQGVYV
ncbi:MAG: hypothetical protein K9G70_08725 [Prolixibacteraceae bacterium]|nr:hypothetical protein [Prolixibacteraceae bacterium]